DVECPATHRRRPSRASRNGNRRTVERIGETIHPNRHETVEVPADGMWSIGAEGIVRQHIAAHGRSHRTNQDARQGVGVVDNDYVPIVLATEEIGVVWIIGGLTWRPSDRLK